MKKLGLITLLFFACAKPKTGTVETKITSKVSYKEALQSTILAWNRFHSKEKIDSLATVYADGVWLFGMEDLPKSKCIATKKRDISKFSTYIQTIDSLKIYTSASVEGDSSKMGASFLKKVQADGKEYQFFVYLNMVWNRAKNHYEIVQESDGKTDENLEIQVIAKEQIYELGDYNGDGKKEKVWLRRGNDLPQLHLYSIIEFSDKQIPSFLVENCTYGVPRNEGDLDGDGADEISLIPGWISSAFTGMSVFTYQKNEWKYLITSVSCRRDELTMGNIYFNEKAYQKLVEKGDSTNTWVWVNPMEWDEKLVQDVYRRKKRKIQYKKLPF